MTRLVMHLDMDAFFAAIEQLRHPEYRGRPVVVGGRGDPTRRGVVSTASYEARRFGIHSGMPLRVALRRCPEAVFLPVDYPAYVEVSGQIKSILRQHAERVEDVGIDEAYVDLTGLEQDPHSVALQIKRRIREQTGLTCSIGIAPNKLLAKIASDMEKPDGITIIGEGDVERRIWPLGVRKLWGVGPKTEQRLAALEVHTIGDLAARPEEALQRELGASLGAYLHRASRGIDERPLVIERSPKTIGRETTFQSDLIDEIGLRCRLDELVDSVIARLHARGLRARNVTVKLRYADFDTHTHGLTLPTATDDWALIRQAARVCLARFALDRGVRLIGVRAGSLQTGPHAGKGERGATPSAHERRTS